MSNKPAIKALLEEIEQTNPEDIADRFDQAWKALYGTTLLTPIACEPMSLMQNYARKVDAEAYESAAILLIPREPEELTDLGANPSRQMKWLLTNQGYLDGKYQNGPGAYIHHPLSSGGGPKVEAFFPHPGMALLIAALKAQLEWG